MPWRTREEIVERSDSAGAVTNDKPAAVYDRSETQQVPDAAEDKPKILLEADGEVADLVSEVQEDEDQTVKAPLDSTPPPLAQGSPLNRRLTRKHFDTALKEIRPSASEEGTLPELRKVRAIIHKR